jgi:Na+/H+ antiporter NhaA
LTPAIILGLAAGKPLGFALASGLAVIFGFAVKPHGIFVAATLRAQRAGRHRFHDVPVYCELSVSADFEAAKITVFIGSLFSPGIGATLL